MSIAYNLEKLTEGFPDHAEKRIAVNGTGAVGSYEYEFLAKLGTGRITGIDMDRFEPGNFAKMSTMIREEDTGKSKALAAARRAQDLMIAGGVSNGIDSNLLMFGPLAFRQYGVVFAALDNFAATVYLNQQLLQLPPEDRPVVFMSGTSGELAQLTVTDFTVFCLRCRMDESWLKNGTVRTSCTGVNLRSHEGDQPITRTSNLASARAALDAASEYDRYVHGAKNVVNTFYTYTPGYDVPYERFYSKRRDDCPDCRNYHPPESFTMLEGAVPETTLGETFRLIEQVLGHSDFELMTHCMEYNKQFFSGLIEEEYCRHCGKPLGKLWLHESRTFDEDLLCDACKAAHNFPLNDPTRPAGTVRTGLTPGTCDDEIKSLTLFRLGWPIGAYLHVRVRGEGLDALDSTETYYTFAMQHDTDWMNKNMTVTKGGCEVYDTES